MLDRLKNMEWAKVLKGGLIAAAGALLAYVAQWATSQDFGVLAPIITAGLSFAIQFVRKLATADTDLSVFPK